LISTSRLAVTGFPSNAVRASRVWRVRLPLLQVYTWEKAHPPQGSGPGNFSDGRGWDLNNGRTITDRNDGYSYPPLAGRTYGSELDLDVSHVQHGAWTRIRADAEERWIVARPSDEKIPGGVRTLAIHVLGRHVRRITRPDVIARVVRWFNSKPVLQDIGGECGVSLGPSLRPVRITFLGPAGKALASAFDPRWSDYGGACNPISFWVGGHAQPELDTGVADSFERFLP
jgi:hypothetical protein